MIISGIQKTSLIDYPRKICTVLFTRGCNFFCGFCHNPELVIPKKYNKKIPNKEILEFLEKRKEKIDAVTITGGEPTIHKDLPRFIKKIKDLGYLVKLDTNGSNPQILKELINQKLINYIAMDVKNSPRKYRCTIQRKIDLRKIRRSVELIKNVCVGQHPGPRRSALDYEFRTTVIPILHDKKSIEDIGKWLRGVKLLIIQQFRPGKHIDPEYKKIKPFTQKQLKEFKKILSKYIQKVQIRGL